MLCIFFMQQKRTGDCGDLSEGRDEAHPVVIAVNHHDAAVACYCHVLEACRNV